MKPIAFALLSLTIFFFACSKEKPLTVFKSNDLAIGIDEKGFIQTLTDVNNNVDYLAKDTIAPLLSIKIDSNIIYPVSASYENDHLIFRFDENGKIVEHWDALQVIPEESKNANSMF